MVIFSLLKVRKLKVIGELVQIHIIEDWQHKSAAQHLQELSDRLTKNKQCSPS